MSYTLTEILAERLLCVKYIVHENARSAHKCAQDMGVLRYFHAEREEGYGAT